jgi:uncharacterized protein YlxP (DUF503 family)
LAVHVGLLTLTLALDWANSLKDKRSILRSTLSQVRNTLHISIAEVGMQNRIRSAEIAATFVGTDKRQIDIAREAAERVFDSDPRIEVTCRMWEWL